MTLLGFAAAFTLSGVLVYLIKGHPNHHGEDAGAALALAPAALASPTSIVALLIGLIYWRRLSLLHRIRSALPLAMYLLVYLVGWLIEK